MKALIKFNGPDLDDNREFAYPPVFERQGGEDWSRLIIGASEKQIALMLDLSRTFAGPYSILYVLIVSRNENECARYESEHEMDAEEIELFFDLFREFLEQDGRHNIWIGADDGKNQLVYDKHNIVYAYGDLDRYEQCLRAAGYSEGEVEIPSPHAHRYHAEFDSAENAILNYWLWTKSPLRHDDDP